MKSYEEILNELFDLIRPMVPNAKELSPEMELVDNLGLDSMKVMNLLQEIEDQFDVSIPLNVLPDVRTVGDLAQKIYQILESE